MASLPSFSSFDYDDELLVFYRLDRDAVVAHQKTTRTHRFTLDPIGKELIAQVKLSMLHGETKIDWITEALKHLLGKGKLRREQPEHRPRLVTFEGVAVQLVDIGLVKTLETDERHATVGIFVVPKTEDLFRVIFDARHANQIIEPLQTRVVLPRLEHILLFLTLPCCRFLHTRDYRHWYYQIPLPIQLRPYFIVKMPGTQCYAPVALPMGCHNAAVCAQATTWAITLYRASGESPLGVRHDEIKKGDMPSCCIKAKWSWEC